MEAGELSLAWSIGTGALAGVLIIIATIVRLLWTISKLRLEIELTLTDHERRLKEAEKKVTTLFDFHNRRVGSAD